MLTNPIAIIAFLAMLPGLFVIFRAITNILMEDRVDITYTARDGTVYRKRIKVARGQDVDKLLTEIAAQSRKKKRAGEN